MKATIRALNTVSANVWAIACIMAGIATCGVLLHYGKSMEPGTMLIGGGLSLLQRPQAG